MSYTVITIPGVCALLITIILMHQTWGNHISVVIVSMITLSALYHGLDHAKTMKLVFFASLTKHASLRNKSKDLLAWNKDNVSGVEQHVYLLTVVSVS
jgi:hypothetical protein